tara:strand:- start:1314 stop:2024 length:711 start_codon:yes stop_codon:yes gene_type:complete
MSKYSKIIVGGCSWTDNNQPQTARPEPLDFKMWPEIVGEKLNCEVINTARCGYGNHAIYHQTLKAIMDNKVDHVFVMWSAWARQDFLLYDNREYVSLIPPNEEIIKWYNNSFSKNFPLRTDPKFIAQPPSIIQLINTNINYIYSLQVICEKLNIKYTACQSMNKGILPSLLIKHPHLEHIKNFYGWPIDKKLGGFTMLDLLKKEYQESYKISEVDAHPNEMGQKFLANKIMEYANA